MTTPTIHLNGTSGESLLDSYRTAMEAVQAAQTAVSEAGPNARDYYPQGPEAWTAATKEHFERMRKLQEVYDELLALAIHCDTINCEREARRKNRP